MMPTSRMESITPATIQEGTSVRLAASPLKTMATRMLVRMVKYARTIQRVSGME